MRRRTEIRRRAELEINRAIIWYEEKCIGLGGEFLAEVRRTIEEIEAQPKSFPVDYRHARRAILGRFPYKIYFVVADDGAISIVGALHASQSTTRLRGRF